MTSGYDLSRSHLRQLRQEAAQNGDRLDMAVIDQIADLAEEHRLYIFNPETKCRVCNSTANKLVNRMLANAMTYRDILRTLEPLNETLRPSERITYESVRWHRTKHFPLEEAAQAVYLRIVEKRAEEMEKDFVRGVGGALTPLAYLDVTMQKGFETLVDNDTRVSVETGMRAAETLHAITSRQNEFEGDMADVMMKFSALLEAVKAEVPEDRWQRILARLDGQEPEREILDAEIDDDYNDSPALDPNDPDFPGDEEDEYR